LLGFFLLIFLFYFLLFFFFLFFFLFFLSKGVLGKAVFVGNFLVVDGINFII